MSNHKNFVHFVGSYTYYIRHPSVKNNGLTHLEGYKIRPSSCKNSKPTIRYVDNDGNREPSSRYICVNDLHSNTEVIQSSFQNYTCMS